MTTILRTLIVDDEPLARYKVRSFLEEEPDVEVAGECAGGEEAVRAIARDRPDVVFLDVQMPGMDGFSVIEAVGVRQMPVTIFSTAYDEFAVRAFESHALDYLLKPYDRARFRGALERAREAVRARASRQVNEQLAALLSGLGNGPQHVKRLLVKDGGQYVFVPVDEIDWIESADNYVALHVGGRTLLVRDTVTGMAAKLDPQMFLRIRSSAIVNLAKVTGIVPWSGVEFQLVLADGTRLLSTRRYHAAIRGLMG
jgi:two-component system LytT family response regulator